MTFSNTIFGLAFLLFGVSCHHGFFGGDEDLSGLAPAKPTTTIDASNNDSIDFPFQIVRQTVGQTEVRGYSYGGSIPGPLIRANEGSTVNLVLENLTDLDTTLHPHGIRLDNAFDGIHDITQPPILPGEKFTYQIFFRDPGVYWYHPHLKDWYARSLGAYGVFLVKPNDPAYYNAVNREEVLVLSDIDVNGIRSMMPHNPSHMLMGWFGDTMLINGNTGYSLQLHQNDVVRFFILNAADVRPFNIAIPGAKLKVVGSDNGKSEREMFSDSVLLGPAERYIVEAWFETPGEYSIVHQTPTQSTNLGSISVDSRPSEIAHQAEFLTLKDNPEIQADIDKYRPLFNKPIDFRLNMELSFGHMGMGPGFGTSVEPDAPQTTPLWNRTTNIEWEDTMPMMNMDSGMHNVLWKLKDAATGKENMDILWSFKQGDIVKIELFNDPNSPHAMQHPIHFHGQRFLVLSINGASNPILQWKDTVLVRRGERVQILLDASNPGDWVFHCHIARHTIEQGANMTMTGRFRVEPSNGNQLSSQGEPSDG